MTVTLVNMDLLVFLENQAFLVERVTEVSLVMMVLKGLSVILEHLVNLANEVFLAYLVMKENEDHQVPMVWLAFKVYLV